MRKTIAVIFIVLSIFALVACNDEPAHEHTWNEGEITTKATCTTDGVMTYTCTGCGEKKTEAIAATGHSIQAVAAKAATCTEAGCTAHYKCDTCSKLFSDAQGATEVTAESVVIAKLNHNLAFVADCYHAEHVLAFWRNKHVHVVRRLVIGKVVKRHAEDAI